MACAAILRVGLRAQGDQAETMRQAAESGLGWAAATSGRSAKRDLNTRKDDENGVGSLPEASDGDHG